MLGQRSFYIWILLFICCTALGSAQAVNLAECRPPKDPDRGDFIIDAANESATGSRRYRLADETRIVVINKNPFVNDYKLDIEEVEIAELALQRFVGAFAFIDGITPQTTDDDSGAGDQAPLGNDPCSATLAGLAAIRIQIEGNHDNLATKDTGIQGELTLLRTAHNNLINQIQPHVKKIERDKVACEDLRGAANDFINAVLAAEPGLDTQTVRKSAAELKKRLAGQSGLVQAYSDAVGTACQNHIAPDVRNWRNQIDVTTGNLSQVEGRLDQLEAAVKTLKEQRKEVQDIGSRTEAFYEAHIIGPYDAPTNVTVELKARKRTSPKPEDFKAVVEAKLNFGGGARFSLSAGIAFASFDNRTYQRIQGFARPSPGGDPDTSSVVAVVGLEEDSDWRTAPLVMLHGRLWESRSGPLGIHASFGLSAKIEDADTDAEYLAGISFSFVGRLFLTVGGYYGSFDRLAGDLYEGAPLPTDLPQPPVKTDHTWKPGLALTYKIQ